MLLRQIFDPKLAQYAYLIGCQRTGEALIIDPERDIDRYLEIAAAEGLSLSAVAETHIHADFLSGARELAEQSGVRLYLSAEGGEDWQYEWARPEESVARGYDVELLHDGDTFDVGNIEVRALHTPGHTPEHLSFLVTDRGSGATEPIGIASGDFVFVGDLGRPDLLESAAGMAGQKEPSARALYRSTARFFDLPDFLQVWPAHGAGSACGKALGAVPSSTVGYEKRTNAALAAAQRGETAFVDSILAGQPEPPPYFATMKQLNRGGPPILGSLPEPRSLAAAELADLLDAAEEDGVDLVVVDTRRDRRGFMGSHLGGSVFAPLDKSFPTIVGSYVRPEQEIVLVVEAEQLEEAVRDLVRIGFDRVSGFVEPEVLEASELASRRREIPVIDFTELERRRHVEGTTLLDVRRASEFGEQHLPGALNIAHTRLAGRLEELPAEAELLVYCRTGARAASAVSCLERSGRRVVLVDDLLETWARWAA